MRSLVTGVDGFIGRWLARALLASGDRVDGLSRTAEAHTADGIRRHRCDITDAETVARLVDDLRPDRVFHLAALNDIAHSFARPHETIGTNISGSLNVFEAVRKHAPSAVLLSIGSSAEYGAAASDADALAEGLALRPSSPYGMSKAGQGMLASLYARAFGLRAIHVRPFAVVGPGKKGDALSDFCRFVAEVEKGRADELRVGNLDAVRDFVDVRDCACALVLLSAEGQTGQTYNLCNGRGERLSAVLKILEASAASPFRVIRDPVKLRSADDMRIVGDGRKLAALGYRHAYTLAETVRDTLDYWRSRPA